MRPGTQLVLLAVVALASPSFAADPAPVGDEFLAAGKSLELPGGNISRQICLDAAGYHYELWDNGYAIGDPQREVRVDRVLPGVPDSHRRIVLDPELEPIQIQCALGGTILVDLYVPDGEGFAGDREYRAFDSSGREIGRFRREGDDGWSRLFGVHDSAGLYEARIGWDGTAFLSGRWIDYDGNARSPDVVLRTATTSSEGTSAPVVDEAGNVLLTWTIDGADYENTPADVEAAVVGPDGTVLGSTFVLNQNPGPRYWDSISSTSEGPATFVAYWNSEYQGGLVGRRIAVDPDAVDPGSVTTTTLPGENDSLAFAPPRRIGLVSQRESELDRVVLASDEAGTWLAGWWEATWSTDDGDYSYAEYVTARSIDNGAHWERNGNLWVRGASVALGKKGRAVFAGGYDRDLYIRISNDSGAKWNQPIIVSTPPGEYRPYADLSWWFSDSSIATDGAGIWGISWSVHEWDDNSRIGRERIFTTFSYDDGATWQDAVEVADLPSEYGTKVSLAADDSSTWLLAWQTIGTHSIQLARSATAGFTWEAPSTLVQLDGRSDDYYFGDPVWEGSLALDRVHGSRWLITFATGSYDVATYGPDGDIFAVRSTDGGLTWGQPKPVNSYAALDGAKDERPTLASDASGRAMVAWRSHDSLAGTVGTDSDILRATSSDAGETWSRPAPVDANAGSDSMQEGFPALAAGANGTWLAAWHSYGLRTGDYDWQEKPHELFVAAAPFHCGDGQVDAAEECDDANDVAGDGCDSNCTRTSCGNGALTDGEECDDGNALNDDDCVSGCRIASCGDSYLHPFVEACDMAASDYSGACLPTCEWATCGDGYVYPEDEQCDDANTDENDGCVWCELARCGDNRVWEGHEECDDYNNSDFDGCIDCRLATCGDGFLNRSVEQCDPARPVPFHPCQSDCSLVESCDALRSSRAASATGALTVLRHAVGIENACTLATCDFNNDGAVSVNDALLALQIAVGRVIANFCPASRTITFVLDDPRVFGALQFVAEHAIEVGTFDDGSGNNDCRSLLTTVFSAASTRWNTYALNAGAISLVGIPGPVEVMSCTFYSSEGVDLQARDFGIRVVEATDLAGATLEPAPVVRAVIH